MEKKNDFGPAALVLALGLAIAAMFWAADKARSAELDGGTTLKYDIAVKETGGSPAGITTKIGNDTDKGFKYTAPHNPALDLPFKMAVGFSARGDDGKDHPITFNIVKEGFATMAECAGKKGVESLKFHKFVEAVANNITKKTGVVVTATAGCIDIREFEKSNLKDAVPEAQVPPKHVPGEKKF